MIDTSHFDNDRELNFRESLAPAMEIKDQADATAYFEAMVAWHVRNHGIDDSEARQLAAHNLGYYAGYYGYETMERVNRLFQTNHPILGYNTTPTPEQAIRKGIEWGRQS